MIPAPGVEFRGIHSHGVLEDGSAVSLWVELTDGTLVAAYFPVAELLERGSVVEEGSSVQAVAIADALCRRLAEAK